MINQNFFTTVLALIIFLTACKKEKDKPTPISPLQEHRIAVKLNSDYLTASAIDSALLFWEVKGQVNVVRMQLSNDTLYTATKTLTEGEGLLTIQVFSRLILRQKKLQWEKRNMVTVKQQESIKIAAPVNYEDPAWFPRVIHYDQPSQFTAIVGLRPEDPYFYMKNIPPDFKIELERNYVTKPGGAIFVGGGLWKCNTVCTDAEGIIENRTFFANLPNQINGRAWEMVEVGVGLFGKNYTSGPGFYFNHY